MAFLLVLKSRANFLAHDLYVLQIEASIRIAGRAYADE
jgi:hypothetical protein